MKSDHERLRIEYEEKFKEYDLKIQKLVEALAKANQEMEEKIKRSKSKESSINVTPIKMRPV